MKLAVLRTFDIFGEMSFLGRCRTSASIIAGSNAEVIVMKVSFLNKIFAAGLYSKRRE
jgi:CRP-like cAMP-binding protein